MEFAIQLFLMGDANRTAWLFVMIGVLAYLIDYKKFKRMKDTMREAKLTKGIALTYMIGGGAMLVLIQVLNFV